MHLVCPTCGSAHRVPDESLKMQLSRGTCAVPLMAAEPASLSDAALPQFIAISRGARESHDDLRHT